MKHIGRFTSIALILLFVLFAAGSTLFWKTGAMRIEASGLQQGSSTKQAEPTSVPDLTHSPKDKVATESATEQNKAVVARLAEAIWKKDLAVAQALVTDSCVIHASGSTYAKGPEAVRQWLADADPNWSYAGSMTDDIIAEGDKVARRTTVFAGYKPNRTGTVTSVVFLYRIADGKIAEVWQVANYVSTYLQAGARIVMPGTSEQSAKKTEAEEEVLKAKREFDEAALHNDADGRARFYTDDYTIVYGDGTMGDRATQLERVRSGRLRYSARSADDVIVRVYGDSAVVIERRKQTATFDGKPRPNDVRATEVWTKRQGRWHLVSTSITPVRPIEDPAPGPFWAAPVTSDSTVSSKGMSTEGEAEIPRGASQAEQEVLKASAELTDAARRNDPDALSHIYADDYIFVPYNGGLSNKEQQVEFVRTGFMKFSAYRIEDTKVRVYGDMAVVIRHRRQVATVGGQTRPGEGRVTSVWAKREGRWQLVSGQMTPMHQDGSSVQDPASGPARTSNVGDHARDEAAIRKNLADVDDAWNRQDAKAIVAHAAPDHDHINVAGAWRQGKLQTEKAMTAYFETHRSNPRSIAQSIERVRFITPDVAILVVKNKYSTNEKTWEAISTSVLHKMNGEWWNEAFQNTLVQSREEAKAQAERATTPMAQAEPQVITPTGSKVDFSDDAAALRKIVAEGADAWNRRDAKALMAHSANGHDQIGVQGSWWSGKAQFEKALSGGLNINRTNMTTSVEKIRFVTSDVAIVIVRREYSDVKETWKSISTSIFHKMDGEWWNEAFQNTYVRPPETSPR